VPYDRREKAGVAAPAFAYTPRHFSESRSGVWINATRNVLRRNSDSGQAALRLFAARVAAEQRRTVMADNPTCTWTGASGTNYTYYIWPRHPNLQQGQDGNYIYAKKNAEGKWVPVYIGEGDLSVRCTNNHHQIECIDSKGATHVHLHLNSREADRKAEEADLLGRYTNAYAPHGCNVKKGG
jgi:hypothetical protein